MMKSFSVLGVATLVLEDEQRQTSTLVLSPPAERAAVHLGMTRMIQLLTTLSSWPSHLLLSQHERTLAIKPVIPHSPFYRVLHSRCAAHVYHQSPATRPSCVFNELACYQAGD